MRTDQRFKKWCRWLEKITEDIWDLNFSRDIFTEVVNIVKNNSAIDKQSPFFGFLVKTYVDSVIMGIRRQLKVDNNSISLAKLLTEIIETPELVTRDDFYSLYEGTNWPDQYRNATMEREFNGFAGPGSPCVDANRVQGDLDLLKRTCAAAEEFADRRVAHIDKRGLSLNLDLQGIFEALDSLGESVRRYQFLFHAKNVDMHPHPTRPIYHIFELPWLPSSRVQDKRS